MVPINGGGMIEIHHCEWERARGAGGSFPLHSFGAEHMYRVRRTFDCFFETSLTSVNSQAQAGGVPLGCEGGLLGACLYPTIARRENAKVAALGGQAAPIVAKVYESSFPLSPLESSRFPNPLPPC